MPRATFWIAALFTASAGAWSLRLVVDPEPFGTAPGALLAADLALLAAVALTGLLLARGRWARAAAAVLSVVWLGLGAAMPLDGPGVAATLAAGGSLAGTAGPWLAGGWLRHRPSATGPPAAAVAVMLGLLAVPGVVAVAGRDGLGPLDWSLAGFSVVAAWGIGRGLGPALWAVRLALPLLAVSVGLGAGLPNGIVTAGAGLAVAAAAWRGDIALAVSPLAAVPARGVPIPPELAPRHVLEAAGYDDRGLPVEGA